ncbi:hypothetical protein TKK_0009778 [Trichogramma kaykai]|uniref:Transcription elongation factor, mitochondrial n=1 Tax=Trichogramma kaykai TaxID=54128 RepID=A0ABD2X218_9HYME
MFNLQRFIKTTIISTSFIKKLINQNKKIKNAIAPISHKYVTRKCSTSCNDQMSQWEQIKSNYTNKQLQLIYETLDICNTKQMKRCGLSDDQIKLLKSNKEKNHQSLEDFILLNTIEVNELENICSTIISKNEYRPRKSAVTPPISKDDIHNIQNVVGLHIGNKYFTCCQVHSMGSSCDIALWKLNSISEIFHANSNLDAIKMAINIAQSIPYADAYIIEKEQTRSQSKITVPAHRILVRQQLISSTILTSLLCRQMNDNLQQETQDHGSLYSLRPLASSQLFKLMFGNESVSSNDIVQSLFSQEDVGLKYVSFVTLTDEILDFHSRLDNFKQEELNKSLLIALTFLETEILARSL